MKDMTRHHNFLDIARVFYKMKRHEVQENLNRLRNWPATRIVDRVLPWNEAVRRIKKDELKQLIRVGMVGVVECYGVLYPVRTIDVVMGVNMDIYVRALKSQIEKAKDEESMLESVIRDGGRPLTQAGIDESDSE